MEKIVDLAFSHEDYMRERDNNGSLTNSSYEKIEDNIIFLYLMHYNCPGNYYWEERFYSFMEDTSEREANGFIERLPWAIAKEAQKEEIINEKVKEEYNIKNNVYTKFVDVDGVIRYMSPWYTAADHSGIGFSHETGSKATIQTEKAGDDCHSASHSDKKAKYNSDEEESQF